MSVITSIDSFSFLLRQFEDDYQQLFSGVCKSLAIIGALYLTKKGLTLTCEVAKALHIHVACQYLPVNKEKWRNKYGPWAVVTGGSEGIGRAYACELAKRGLSVVVISRSEAKLVKAKAMIESQRLNESQGVDYIVADFSAPDQTTLYKHIQEKLSGKQVGLLVNNVGLMYDHPDTFLNIPTHKLHQLTSVNVGAATMMSSMLLPAMVERGRGGLVVFSSSACAQVTPGMTAYAAGKKYLEYFLEGIAYEYKGSGVEFQCLTPFYVATQMTGFTNKLQRSWLVPDASDFAKSAVNTLGYSQLTTGYLSHTIQLWLTNLVSGWIWKPVASKMNEEFKRDALDRQKNQRKEL